jgi:hypothetical protein
LYNEEAAKPTIQIKLGLLEGQMQISDDFDAPLPYSFWLEGKI